MIQGLRSMPILLVKDIGKSVDFYSGGLGFILAGSWNNEQGNPNFAIVKMDKITVGLQWGAIDKTSKSWAAYFFVEDIDAFAAQVAANGVNIMRDITEQRYGCRDLEINDPDGNILCFGQDMSPDKSGPGL